MSSILISFLVYSGGVIILDVGGANGTIGGFSLIETILGFWAYGDNFFSVDSLKLGEWFSSSLSDN